jgi:hypothetical protein
MIGIENEQKFFQKKNERKINTTKTRVLNIREEITKNNGRL